MLRLPVRHPHQLIWAPLTAALLAASFLFVALPANAASAQVGNAPPAHVTLDEVQGLIFVWASGTPAVQRVASESCGKARLTASQCAAVSVAVRGAWLELAANDPAALGRVGAQANLTARAQALGALGRQLASIAGGHMADLLAVTASAYAQISAPGWAQSHVAGSQALPAGTVLVWATSFQQSSLPGRLNAKRSAYVALPDAYVKYANWGNISSIPSIYQPFYAPLGKTAHWTVNITAADGTHSLSNVLVTDVGPWNEDDNWWDPNGTSATLAASCPVASNLIAPDATSNPLVNGICPNNGQNLRRLYYYLLYQHDGLPFFQSSGYAPTGNFQDGTAWPTALGQQCAEAAVASVNNDGVTCSGGPSGYNANNASWLRNGTYNAPILNQSSIDVSPAVDKALGWVYPSSGLIQVYVGGLP
jgi:hypothetical protein